jgi:hypothetical protein
LLELRTEYERKPRADVLIQIKERAAELNEQASHLPGEIDNPPAFPHTLG